MTADRWKQIDDLFHKALAVAPEERPTFLDAACGADDDLRRQVEALLRADAAAPPLLDATLGLLATAVFDDTSPDVDLASGMHVGPYRIDGVLGQGGMGIVYLAHRADGLLDRAVALKVIKRGMDTDEILRRFRYEREILARLEHPHIARLYDAGVAADGRPYLAMEYVDGVPLRAYCDAQRLTIDERLALLQTVCEAVQYAHQNLVVHRDLKPSNILITGEGRVKLLDFGIAKLLSDEPEGAPRTRTGVRIMTPTYAAPEQLRGEAITTATDVYALGIVAYEVLTGRRPIEHDTAPHVPPDQALLDGTPERPSNVVTRPFTRSQGSEAVETVTPEAVSAARSMRVDQLRRRLQGDLDTILLKALRQEPSRRYASAEAFARDIERHLAGVPVSARPDTVGYRLQKFITRHKGAVAAALLVAVSLLAGLTVALWQARRAEQERDVARQVSGFLEDLFRAPDPTLIRSERLDTLRVGAFLRLNVAKVRTELGDDPQLKGSMLHILGGVFTNLALYDEAEPILEEALTLRRQTYGERHPEVAHTLEALGLLYHKRGAYAAAESLHQQVLTIRTERLDPSAIEVAQSHANLALALSENGRFDEARLRFRRALDLAAGSRDAHAAFYAETANNFGNLLYQEGDYEAAEPLFRESIEIMRDQPNPRHPKMASTLNNLGSLLHYTGHLEAAEPLYEEALSIFREVYGAAHPEISNTLQNLATLYDDWNDHARADSLYRLAIRMDRQLVGDVHPNVGLTIRNLGLMQLEIGSNEEAEALLREAAAIFEETLPEDHFYRSLTQISLGKALLRQHKLDEAAPYLLEGSAALATQLPADHWLVAAARRDLGAYYTARKDFEQAEPLLLDSYEALRSTRGADAAATQECLEHLMLLYEAWGRPEQATTYRDLLSASG